MINDQLIVSYKMLMKLISLEYKRYKERGFLSLISLSLLYLYFTFLPILSLSLYKTLPSFRLYPLFVIGSFMVHLVVYLTANSFFTLLYILENPLIESWKISKEPWPWKSDPLFKDKLIKVLKSFLLNNTIVIIPLSLLQGLRVNYLTRPEDFPSLSINFFQILFFILVEDCLFYWSHRILHSAYLYKNIHKQHHEFNISISVASEYSHPLEFFIGNIVPVGAGPFILRVLSIDVHILTWFLWITFRSFHTSEGHSGYNLPFSPFRFLPFGVSSRFHDDHHLKNLGNFGSMLVFWDSICGTNQELKSKKD